jgi:lipopolysaccharide transport system ATP-binding protein
MSTNIVKMEGVSKCFRIQHKRSERYATLRDVVAEKVNRAISYRKLSTSRATTEDFWALENVSFEVDRGEIIGIIGKNGAGKSTLLKILSRITEPTAGRLELSGRVGSLLEVGTGFHPELTGRENIFLNGAIMGMTRAEIKRRFDEIVAFAEVERFLDTPIKRYSSGMYVRLGFAVAAHLECEILLVDEVLAVGDTEFQKKCFGKIEEVVGGGRTVFLVSHQLQNIARLCTRAIVLNSGKLVFDGQPSAAISSYLEVTRAEQTHLLFNRPSAGSQEEEIVRLEMLDELCKPKTKVFTFDFIRFRFFVNCARSETRRSLVLELRDNAGVPVLVVETNPEEFGSLKSCGLHAVECCIEQLSLLPGQYSVSVGLAIYGVRLTCLLSDIAQFEVLAPHNFHQNSINKGAVALKHCWLRSRLKPEEPIASDMGVNGDQILSRASKGD